MYEFLIQIDLYTPSQYKVFQKVTDNANAAMLNFYSPGISDLSVRSFFVSISSGIWRITSTHEQEDTSIGHLEKSVTA